MSRVSYEWLTIRSREECARGDELGEDAADRPDVHCNASFYKSNIFYKIFKFSSSKEYNNIWYYKMSGARNWIN